MNELQTTEIKQIELEINFYKEQTARNIIEIGKRLIKAKELVPYGEWGKWLDDKVEFSQSMASKFMKVAIEFGDSESIPKVGLSKLIMLTSVSQEERETFIEENPVEDMTTRELRQAIKENKELLEGLAQHKHQEEILREENESLKEIEPQIIEKEVEKIVEKIVQVVPDDYEYYKNKEYELSSLLRQTEEKVKILNSKISNQIDPIELKKLQEELKEKTLEIHDMDKQIKSLIKVESSTKHQEKLKDSALIFCTRVHTFLNDVGGLAWLTEYIGELEDYDKRSYVKALDLLEGWVMTVKSNINKEEF